MKVTMRPLAFSLAVVAGFAAVQGMQAACNTTVVQYKASGVFGATPLNGKDTLKLAGEPFSITMYACESLVPTRTGANFAEYYPLATTVTVKSSLQTQQFTTSGKMAFTIKIPAAPGLPSLAVQGPLPVLGSTVTINGSLALPAATLPSTHIATFPSTAIVTSRSQLIYTITPSAWKPNFPYAINVRVLDSNNNQEEATVSGTSGATQPVWNTTVGGTTNDGTVVWTNEGPLAPTTLAVIGNAVGTVYTPAKSSPKLLVPGDAVIDPAASAETATTHFYAAGITGASDLHVRIGGQEVPVLYAGPSASFPGLEEVSVEVPRSLAGMGDAEVSLNADGQTAEPLHIRIQ